VHQDAAKFLRVLLVCLVGDKAGRVPSCPTWLTHGATSERVLLEGLRRTRKSSGSTACNPVALKREHEQQQRSAPGLDSIAASTPSRS
ncbi:unnamed protein product, partial [Pylaiella littoralis]